MKLSKILLVFGVFLLMISLVFAQGNAPEDKGKPEDVGNPNEVEVAEDSEEDSEAKSKSKGTSSPKGLEVALTKVTNENALARIQENIERFEENYAQRMSSLEDVEVESVDEETGEVSLKAKENVKYFGFINGKATKRFNINAEGAISEHAPWYSLFYSEVDSEEMIEETESEIVEEEEESEEESTESETEETTETEDSEELEETIEEEEADSEEELTE